MLNKIVNPSFVSFSAKEKIPSKLYQFSYVNNNGIVVDRYLSVSKKGYELTLTDSEGYPKSGLSRVLTPEEAAMAGDIKSSNMQTYIDFIDAGLKVEDAVNIAKSNPKIEFYKNFPTPP